MKFVMFLFFLSIAIITGLFIANSTKHMTKTLTKNIKQSSNLDLQSIFNADYKAPELVGITAWINPDKQFTLSSYKGKVILVDFWTNQCINCIHTLPYVTKWYDSYKDKGFIVIGVHTPELPYEYTISSIQSAIKLYGINYPVVQDNNYVTWKAYNNQYWPAEFLIDKNGYVRRTYFGEGEYDKTELAIQTLLKE